MGLATMTEPVVATTPVTPPRAPFRWRHLAIWLPLCCIHGTAMAWLAFGIQSQFAPLLLFPALVGLGAGATLVGLMRVAQVSGRPVLLAGVLVSCSLTVVGQHFFSYQQQRAAAEQQALEFRKAAEAHPDLVRGTVPQPALGLRQFLHWQAMRGRPIGGEIVARGAWAWASWAAEGLITVLVAMAIVVPAARQPYCDQCRSWYRTMRRGKLDAESVVPLADAAGLEIPDGEHQAQYRLVSCQGGCGAIGFEICWDLADGRSRAVRSWVAAEDRATLMEKLGA